jgi:hypothetical protein
LWKNNITWSSVNRHRIVLYYYVPISCTHHPKIKLIGKYRLFIYTLTLSLICSSINFISLNMQVYHINYLMSCHLSLLIFFLKIQGACHITLCHVIFLYLKIILNIQGGCDITSCHVTFLNWKIILKIQRNHLIPHHFSPLKSK